ncbi:MAG: dihydropteroate synthase [Lachnospiraceae bacterium]|nr:dihydropteroate synthase [Lachnospiraceae bacterium]MCI9589337.1 dihydropteroate synthase [Lachnospiraceae bacterium]
MYKILEEMKKRRLFFDGGTGSILQAKGLKAGELPETWNILHPEILVELHKDYLKAGADIINTNTFGANGLKFYPGGEFDLEQVIKAAVSNAREAVRQAGKEAFIALDMGPTGKLLKPLGDLDFEAAVGLYRDIARIGAGEGVDLALIETMSDSYEIKAAVLGVKEACDLPVFVTMVFDEKGKLLTGGTVESMAALLEGLGVDGIGVNCGLGPVQMKPIVEKLLKVTSLPVIVNPNAGLPRSQEGRTVYDIDSEAFAREMKEIASMGAVIVGGCCGTTPEHIKKTVDLCRELPVSWPKEQNQTVVSSYSRAVIIGRDPVIIGERINPTGKSKFKQALRDHDLEHILREAAVQQDNGAHILDVNVGLPEIDEPSMMEEVIKELQSITELPLQIDTSNVEAMERGMRVYNGKPLINSVNGKDEVMEAVFPLVKKYGGTVVALCLDEDGIPDTAEGRIRIAEKIYDRAARYGIKAKDILVDGLCMTVSSDSKGALTTLETLRRIRDDLGGKSILGVSNISFGLPQREIINAAFFTMALENGLNAAIINPNSEAMMRAYYSYRALAGLDPQCSSYIGAYGGQKKDEIPLKEEKDTASSRLFSSIVRGLKEGAARSAKGLLGEQAPLEIINQTMIPALDFVGQGFEKGTIFLPQLLMSAEAAKAAFEVIKDEMQKLGQAQEKKGKIILATVQGDIHDIGKNIVKVLLENYSYEVIDLGRDVPPETVADRAVLEQVPLVGLSALMTTTVPSMEATIRLLQKKAPWVKIMAGGAVLTREYAETIGADCYCKDAMASVNYAESVICGPALKR